jgi:L-threonylcarbamoyladenylate synthase
MICPGEKEWSMDERVVDEAVAAIRAGKPVILPTDTVYGLCASPDRAEPVLALYRLKGRGEEQPTALLASDLQTLFEYVPELRDREGLRALLPGPVTLVLPNPARRFRWLTGTRPETIGVRVPALEGEARAIVERVGALAATSANLPGRPDPRRLEEVPEEIRAGCAALVDGGELPGTPSTVLDLTGSEPVVLREGAVPSGEALARLAQRVY